MIERDGTVEPMSVGDQDLAPASDACDPMTSAHKVTGRTIPPNDDESAARAADMEAAPLCRYEELARRENRLRKKSGP